MQELIKNVLFYIALGAGSAMLISLFIYGSFRCLCLLLDTFKTADVLRKALLLYIKQTRPNTTMKEEDIDVKTMTVKRKYNKEE